ncbi:MAG TPA: ParB/RepB/Spo0J family partition protein [Firmicutes bacterium]|jgi:ParB family chromosome partitioning protein|nr:ParB/RepB/Spo0J family partition protein [Bacillota bacterium]
MKLTDVLRSKARTEAAGTAPPEVGYEQEVIEHLPIHLIQTSQYQPRSTFDEDALDELAQSIAEHGVLHPIVVRRSQVGYELVVGERRLRACRMLGFETIPALIRDFADKQAAELALIENLQRKDLRLFEEAEGYRRLLDEFGMTQDELAARLGKSQSSIANKLRLLKLPEAAREIISREMLSERHARALLRLDREDDVLKVLGQVVERNLNVRQTEELVERVIQRVDVEAGPLKEPPKRTLVLKDLRTFRNSIKSLTDTLQRSGLEVAVEERESDDAFELLVVVRKPVGVREDG